MSGIVERFELSIPQAQLDDLRERLARTRWPEPETVDDWSQGVPLKAMRALVDYWRDGYDWRRCEASSTAWASSRPRSTGSASISSTSARPKPTRCR